ncbi:hypothetical protein JTB14_024099 [Gonioctena quinquepunctata]|nr:hypothetical protein JTB14_024099 [Gonioctena quinquepunctata]
MSCTRRAKILQMVLDKNPVAGPEVTESESILDIDQCDTESELDSEQKRIAYEMVEFINFGSCGSEYIPPPSSSNRISSSDAISDARTSSEIIQETVLEGNIDGDNLPILAVNQCDDESELDSEQERIANEMEEFIDFESSGSEYIPPSSSSDRMSSSDAGTSSEIIQETVLEGNIGWDNSNEASTSEALLPLAPQAVVPPSTLARPEKENEESDCGQPLSKKILQKVAKRPRQPNAECGKNTVKVPLKSHQSVDCNVDEENHLVARENSKKMKQINGQRKKINIVQKRRIVQWPIESLKKSKPVGGCDGLKKKKNW